MPVEIPITMHFLSCFDLSNTKDMAYDCKKGVGTKQNRMILILYFRPFCSGM